MHYQTEKGFSPFCESALLLHKTAKNATDLRCTTCISPFNPYYVCCCNCYVIDFPGVTIGYPSGDIPDGCLMDADSIGPRWMKFSGNQCQQPDQMTGLCRWDLYAGQNGLVSYYLGYTVNPVNHALVTTFLEISISHPTLGNITASYQANEISCEKITYYLQSQTNTLDCGLTLDIQWPSQLDATGISCDFPSSSTSSSGSGSSSGSSSSSSSRKTHYYCNGTCQYEAVDSPPPPDCSAFCIIPPGSGDGSWQLNADQANHCIGGLDHGVISSSSGNILGSCGCFDGNGLDCLSFYCLYGNPSPSDLLTTPCLYLGGAQ